MTRPRSPASAPTSRPRIDRGQELHRLLVDNLACAAQFLESCRQAMKRLDFTQATIDAHIARTTA